jgi:hypothetical protein
MRGSVEIYSGYGTENQELVLKEDNLVVDGAGEAICDMLTTASGSISGVSNSSSTLTDASNFTIRAFSMGKGQKSYQRHGHFFPKDSSSYTFPTVGDYHGYVNLVRKDTRVRVVSYVDENITWTVKSFDPVNDPGLAPRPVDTSLERDTRTAIDRTLDQAHKMNGDYMAGRAHAFGHNLNRIMSNTNPNLMSYTVDPLDANLGDDFWTSANLSNFNVSSLHSGPFYGTSALHLSGSNNSNHLIRQRAYLSPYGRAKRYFHENLDHTFSVYTRMPDDIDKAPATLVMNIRATTQAGTVKANNVGTFTKTGGASGIPAHFVFSTGTNGIKGDVETLEVGSTSSHVGWQRLHLRLEGLGSGGVNTVGNRLNYVDPVVYFTGSTNTSRKEMYHYGYQLEESFGPTEYQSVSGIRPTLNEGGISGDTFLGCYPDVSGTRWAILNSISGVDSTNSTDKVIISGIYPDVTNDGAAYRTFFNCSAVRAMDQNGFIKVHDASTPLGMRFDDEHGNDGSAIYTSGVKNLQTSGMKMSVGTLGSPGDFSSTGEVSYTCTISSGDLGLANLYGGVFKLGLWTIDLPNTMQGNYGHYHDGKFSPINKVKYPAQPPFNFKAGFNRIVYKLFCEKSLTLNLGRVKDNGSDSGSLLGHQDLTVVWKLKFI